MEFCTNDSILNTIDSTTEVKVSQEFALRIYKENGELKTVLTTRLGLKCNEGGVFETDLSQYNGLKFTLYNITTQKEVKSGIIGEQKSEPADAGE